MKTYYRNTFLFLVVVGAVWMRAPLAWAVNVTTVVLPNGGECLTVGTTYTISFSYSGADVEHIALYYRTDGAQPTHLDASEIKHPINVPQQATTYSWKPTSSHISETGRIWVDGHENGHASLNTWDSSNANFAVRSSCAAAAEPIPARLLLKVPQPPAGFQDRARVADVIPSPSSGRIRFESPWEKGEYRVRLVEERDGQLMNLAVKDVGVNPGDIIEFTEFQLKPNTFYNNKRHIVGYHFESSTESILSEVMRPFWTLLENPKQLEARDSTATSTVLTLLDEIPNLGAGLTGVLFEEVNSMYSSGWLSTTTSWQVTGLAPDTQYQFFAKLRSGGGNEIPDKALITFRTKALPPLGPSPEEFQTQQIRELEERVKKIAKVVTGYQELATARKKEAKEEVEEVVEELPPPKPLQLEIPEKKIVAELLPQVPPRPPQRLTVTFDGENFNPASLEILEGDTVEWRNKSSRPVWPAVNPHPTHTGLLGFDAQGFLLAGEFYRFTFRRLGAWPYHDHQSTEKKEKAASGSIEVLPRLIPEVAAIAEEKVSPLASPPPVVARKVRKPVKELPSTRPVLPEELRKLEKELLTPVTLLAPPPAPALLPPRPPKDFVVIFDEGKFKPQVLEIHSGDSVRFMNQADRPIWPASDPHPTHTGLSGFDALGDLLRDETYRYTLTKAGSVSYHNHTVARVGDIPEAGVIIVKP